MDASDAMEVTEPISAVILNAEEDDVDKHDTTTNESAMEQLSLGTNEAPLGTSDPTYRPSPTTDNDSLLAPDNETETVNEKGTVNEERENDVDNSKPRSRENTAPPQSQDDAPLNGLLLLANASTALATETNTNETTIDTEMEEATPVIPESTAVEVETPNDPPAEPPSMELGTDNVNSAPSPMPTAMDEDANSAPPPNADANAAATKDINTKSTDGSGWGPLDDPVDGPEKGKGANADGWGVDVGERPNVGGDWSLTEKPGWGGGDLNSTPKGTNTSITNGDSGFGGRGGGWGNKGRDNNRDRDSYRDRDRGIYRDGDGLRRNRPTSYGNGSGFGSGGPPFASGSNAELLPALGRSPVKNGDRHARLARSAPYPPRRETRSADWDSPGLDYGNAGDSEDLGGGGGGGTVAVSRKPVVLKEVDIGGLDTLSKMMSNADIKSITSSLMDHIGRIQKLRNDNKDAHKLIRQCGHLYEERKLELKALLEASSSPSKRAEIASKLEKHRAKGTMEENVLAATVLNTETSLKREVEALLCTISEAMADKIHACILDVVRAVSTGNGTGSPCDVEKVVERCVMMAAPKLLKDQLGAQERALRGLERRVVQLDETVQERDKTIVDLNRRLRKLEEKLEPKDLMVTDTSGPTVDDGSDGAPDVRSSYATNCVHQ